MYGGMDGWMDEQTNEWIDRWMDGWMDGFLLSQLWHYMHVLASTTNNCDNYCHPDPSMQIHWQS
jgi:hypothetical protein